MTDSITSTLSRKVIITLQPGEDFLGGILDAYQKYELNNAIVTSCIGSLSRICYSFGVKDSNRLGVKYDQIITREIVQEILCGQGFIARDDEGVIIPHIHVVFADEKGLLHGGHIFDRGNIVAATMEICLEECPDIKLIRKTIFPDLPDVKLLIVQS